MEWTIYYVLYLLNKTLKRVNISIIIKVKTFSFEQCITCLSTSYKVTIRTLGSSLVLSQYLGGRTALTKVQTSLHIRSAPDN